MRHQAQKGFRGIFLVIPQHQKWYLVYVPSTRKVISSYVLRFDESFVSALSYTSRPYAEAMAMRPAVTYTPYATSSKEQTGDIITFAQSEEGNLLSETCNDTESGDESDIVRLNYLFSTGYIDQVSFLMLWYFHKDAAKTFMCLVKHV